MAVSLEYQYWSSTDFNWTDKTTATSAPVQINDKLTAWVNAVNANPSNANRQITIEKNPSSSTSTNYVGWVLKIQNSIAAGVADHYLCFFSTGTNSGYMGVAKTWTFNTSNGGYGAIGSPYSYDSGSLFTLSGNSADVMVCSDTDNGIEFFFCFLKVGTNSSYWRGFMVFKDTNGEWVSSGIGTSNTAYTAFYMPTHSTPQLNFGSYINPASTSTVAIFPLMLIPSTSTYYPAAGLAFTHSCYAANPALYCSQSSSVYGWGKYANLANGKTAICLGSSYVFVVI